VVSGHLVELPAVVSGVWLPIRRLPASMNHGLTQAENGCWFGHLGGILQADLPSPGTGWAKADAKGGAGVDLPHSGGARNQNGSPRDFPSNFRPTKGGIKWRAWLVSDTSSGI